MRKIKVEYEVPDYCEECSLNDDDTGDFCHRFNQELESTSDDRHTLPCPACLSAEVKDEVCECEERAEFEGKCLWATKEDKYYLLDTNGYKIEVIGKFCQFCGKTISGK